ncbi:fimbrial protein [Erwinia amylovora]
MFRKIAALLLLSGMMFAPVWVQAACNLKSGGTVKGSDSIDLSQMFISSGNISESRSATWSVPLTCYALLANYVNFVTPFPSSGYVVRFDNAAGNSRWVKFTVTNFASEANMGGGLLPVYPTLNGSTLSYTLAATLLTTNPGVTDANNYQVVQGGTATLVPMVVTNINHGSLASIPTSAQAAAVVASGSWNSSLYLAYQSLTVTFNPKETTCDMPDQTVTMPRVSLANLRDGSDDGHTSFQLPVSCSNTLAGLATRSVNAWLFSSDLVDSNKQIMRNSSSSSSGVGITLTTSSANPVTFSDSTSAGTGATSLMNIVSGGKVSGSTATLNAAYKIFDQSNLRPGSVVATATLYFNYD